jgi:hypothetical protein
MSIFVGVTPQEVAQIEVAVREYLMKGGMDTTYLQIEARNVYLEDNGSYTASLRIASHGVQAARSTYTLVFNGIFEVTE